MHLFKDKTTIVVGGARDIGRACSIKLGALGARVVVAYANSADEATATVAEIEAAGGKAIAVRADATKAADVAGLVTATTAAFGPEIHALVHVTGGLVARKTLAEMDEPFWHQVMDLNISSLFLVTQAVVPHMPKGGAIVTFASQAGRDGGGPGALAYATSKGAVISFTRGLAKEIGPDIRVNSICAGMISTTFHDTFTKDEVRGRVAGATALKREGRPEEVAELAAWLASDAASYLTGTAIDINGGLLFS
jgi:3-oxoacyl-[acyl-carrier protein] reductase